MTETHIDTWHHGRGCSIAHKATVYHFRYCAGNAVELTCVDILDSDTSLRGQDVPAVPNAVKDELRQNGVRVV